jgi:rubrerythrin
MVFIGSISFHVDAARPTMHSVTMSPTQLLIRTSPWVCPCCGEVERTARQPQTCITCGRKGSSFEQQRGAAIPAD